jgi:hypothetical protein
MKWNEHKTIALVAVSGWIVGFSASFLLPEMSTLRHATFGNIGTTVACLIGTIIDIVVTK